MSSTEGRPCEFMLEHVLVDSAMLLEWEKKGGGTDDELHEMVVGWMKDGHAVLDHTAWVAGISGDWNRVDQIVEQTYPTEFLPGGKGAWPHPTSFETRNCGYSFAPRLTKDSQRWKAEWEIGLTQMISPGRPYHPMAERTREDGDVFVPEFRSLASSAGGKGRGDDPFTEEVEKPAPAPVVFEGGRRYLWGRFDEAGRDGDESTSRLVFVRSVLAPEPVAAGVDRAMRIKLRVFRASHEEIWSWLNEHPGLVQDSAWDALREGSMIPAWALEGWLPKSGRTEIENVREYLYPTEWVPGMKWQETKRWEELTKRGGKDGVATQVINQVVEPAVGVGMAMSPTSFETRNRGESLDAEIDGERVRLFIRRVEKVGDSVHHRVQEGEDWVADATMPEFSYSYVSTSLPARPCGWKLVGVGGEFLEQGRADREHRLLYFVKLE